MSEEIVKEVEVSATGDKIIIEEPEFKGYTLSQLRYQRALVSVKRDFTYASILNDINRVRHRKLFFGGKGGQKADTWAGKIFSGMNYLDYALLGLSAFSSIRKVFSFFKRK